MPSIPALQAKPILPVRIPQQIVPSTPQRLLEPHHGRQQDVDVAGLDFLDRPDVQIHQFGQFFLGDFPGHPLPANIAAESRYLCFLFGIERHAPLRRIFILTTTALWGVNVRNLTHLALGKANGKGQLFNSAFFFTPNVS